MQRQLEDWIDTFLEYTENTEPPRSFLTWVGISTIAAVLERKCWLMWEKPIYPNMFIVLVAPGGRARKSTAMHYGKELLVDTGVHIAPEASTREALIRRIKNSVQSSKADNDIVNHNSLTVFSSELTVLIGYKNQQLLTDLCDWYDCASPWKYETKNVKLSDHIDNLWFNLLGATTPESLAASLPAEAVGSGLTSRIVFVYEHDKEKTIFIPPTINTSLFTSQNLKAENKSGEIDEIKTILSEELSRIQIMQGEFVCTEECIEAIVEFTIKHEKELPFKDTVLETWAHRKRSHLLKVAMVMSASRSNNRIIEAKDFQRALDIINDTQKNMLKTFSGIGQSNEASIIATIMRIVAERGEILYSELLDIPIVFQNADEDTIKKAIAVLVVRKIVVVEGVYEDLDKKKRIDNKIINIGTKTNG